MRIPFLPTVIVAVMMPAMIALGIWQLQRAEWKASILAELAEAPAKPVIDLDSAWPSGEVNFRHASATCTAIIDGAEAVAGYSRRGASGYSYRVPCRAGLTLVAGWAPRPGVNIAARAIGPVTGTLVDRPGDAGLLLYADVSPPPLEPSAPPSIRTISNNHVAYAVQWFAFAAILSIIYGIYVIRRRRCA